MPYSLYSSAYISQTRSLVRSSSAYTRWRNSSNMAPSITFIMELKKESSRSIRAVSGPNSSSYQCVAMNSMPMDCISQIS